MNPGGETGKPGELILGQTTVIDLRGRDHAALQRDPSVVYVGRASPRTGWPGSSWANPFRAGNAVMDYVAYLRTRPELLRRLPELRGKRLGCWCADWDGGPGEPCCHAIALARMADGLDPLTGGALR